MKNGCERWVDDRGTLNTLWFFLNVPLYEEIRSTHGTIKKILGITFYRRMEMFSCREKTILGISLTRKQFSQEFPDACQRVTQTFLQNPPAWKTRRIAVFASFSRDGKIADYVIHYLKALGEITDGIVLIADNPIFPEELEKIKGLVWHAEFSRHDEYDFGSYKRGFCWLKSQGLLDNAEELLVCNDSCRGPVWPFQHYLDLMTSQSCDFWGMTGNINKWPVVYDGESWSMADREITYLQSYFYVFRKSVLESEKLSRFFEKVTREESFRDVVLKYEIGLAVYLEKNGFHYAAVAKGNDLASFPVEALKNGIPLIKNRYLAKNYKGIVDYMQKMGRDISLLSN